MAVDPPPEGGGDGVIEQAARPARTKSSVRRAREFKQFDEVNLLDVDTSDGFELIQKTTAAQAKSKAAPPALGSDGQTFSKRPPKALEKEAALPKDHLPLPSAAPKEAAPAAGANSSSSGALPAGKRPPHGLSPAAATASAHSAPAARVGRSTAPYRSGTTTQQPAAAAVKKPVVSTVELQDLKDEIAKVRQAASDKEDLLEKYRVDAVSWKMEKTQLLAEMTTGEQELERVRNSLKELEESLEVASRERHTALSKTKEAEGALAQVASARVISEERSTELQTKIDGLVRSEALLHERVQCLVVSNQELARSAEVERIQHQAGARVLENRVVQLTEALDKLTLSMKKEQGMSQNARRSLEAVEAVNKRIEAEKTLLEATIQAHGDRVVSVSEPNATFDRNNTSFSTNLTNSPSFHCHAPTPPAVDPTGADELWAVINDLESSKKATEAKHAAEVEELTKNAAAVVHDKEALWQECERLTRQLEGLQATQGSTTPCTTAEADSQTDVTSPQCPAALSLSTGRTFLATFTELSFSESAVKAAAPDASPALLGGVTRFGFVPPSSLWDRFPGSPASSGAMTDRRDRRRSALQDARNARKAEVSVAQASSRQHAYDSILGDVRWSPPMQQTPR